MGDERTREGGEPANAAPSAAPTLAEEVQSESPAENASDERQTAPTDQTPSFWRAGLEGAWPVFLGLLPALATLLSLVFVIRPSWRPVEPPQVRGVQIKDVVLAERQRTLAGGEEVTVVYYDIEAVGYDADRIMVATEWIDVVTLQSTGNQIDLHGVLTANTRTDRLVGWLDVRYPTNVPEESNGCLVVRVLLYPAQEDDGDAGPEVTTTLDHPPILLDFGDTLPFDPYEIENPECAGNATPIAGTA